MGILMYVYILLRRKAVLSNKKESNLFPLCIIVQYREKYGLNYCNQKVESRFLFSIFENLFVLIFMRFGGVEIVMKSVGNFGGVEISRNFSKGIGLELNLFSYVANN